MPRRPAIAILACFAALFIGCGEKPSQAPTDSDPIIKSGKFSATPLLDVIHALRAASGKRLPIEDLYPLQFETRVTVNVSDLRLSDALDKLMFVAGGENLKWRLTDPGAIEVVGDTDIPDDTPSVVTRAYDLHKAIGDRTGGPNVDAMLSRVRGIRPLSWKESGGSIGSVRALKGFLIITHQPKVHDLIAAELKDELPTSGSAG